MAWLLALLILNTVGCIAVAIRDVFYPVRTLTWICIGLLLPGLGLLAYFVLAQPIKTRRRHTASEHLEAADVPPGISKNISEAVTRITHIPPQYGHVEVLQNGLATTDSILHHLAKATQRIDMEYYIFRDDSIGQQVIDCLVERARAGVAIRFLRDGLGSRKLPAAVVQRMIDAGIDCRSFYPIRFPWIAPEINHRDHCKIVTIDGTWAFVGGINVGNEYTGLKAAVGPWRDTHLRVEGPAVQSLQRVFNMNWGISTKDRKKAHSTPAHRPAGAPETRRLPLPAHAFRVEVSQEIMDSPGRWTTPTPIGLAVERRKSWSAQTSEAPGSLQRAVMQTIESGPDSPSERIRDAFFLAITGAERQLDITTPYFVPDSDILVALKTAVTRGVRVRLLVPLQCDHRLIGLASRTFYQELLAAGIEIFLYHAGILHAKVMVVDHDLSMVGAANYDLRSFRLNYEVMQVIYSANVAEQLRQQFDMDLKHASPLHTDTLSKLSWWQRGIDQGARLLAPLL